jgi:hypothetical protein
MLKTQYEHKENTKVIKVAKREINAQVCVETTKLKQTTKFTYSGSVIASNVIIHDEIKNICCKANQFIGQFTPNLKQLVLM